MLVALQGPNNITAYRLFTTCYGMLSDSYRHQTTKNFEKLLTFKGIENTLIIIAPILLVLHMLICPTRLLEDDTSNAEFDAEGKLRPGSTGLSRDERGKIERVLTADKDNKDEEDPQKKNKQLKRE